MQKCHTKDLNLLLFNAGTAKFIVNLNKVTNGLSKELYRVLGNISKNKSLQSRLFQNKYIVALNRKVYYRIPLHLCNGSKVTLVSKHDQIWLVSIYVDK